MRCRFVIGFLLFTPMNAAYSALSSEQMQFNQLFTHSAKPPKGFEMLAKKQILLIDVYYLGRFIMVAKVEVSPTSVLFIELSELLEKVGPLKQSQDIITHLQKPMPTNSDLICGQKEGGDCNQLEPDNVGVIYDPNLFRMYLFINPKYLKPESKTQWLEPSTAKLSYLNNVSLAADSGNPNFPFANLHDSLNTLPLYNITSDNVLAFYNTRLNVSATYANRANFTTVYDNQTTQLNALNIAHTFKQYEYSIGLIEIPSTLFFASNTILGAEIKTTLNTLRDKALAIASPITLFLPLPSTVSIIKGSTIIYSAKLPAGNQKIDTSLFPQGTYPVSVRINDAQGGANVITKMVTNSILLAPFDMPQHYFSLGYLMRVQQFNYYAQESVQATPVYQAGINYRISNNVGLGVKVLGTDKVSFFNPGITFLQRDFSIQGGGLFGSDARYGYTANVTWQKKRWTANYTLSEITYPKAFKPSCDFNLLNQGVSYSGVSLGYGYSSGTISLFYAQNSYDNWQNLYTYGINFTKAIALTSTGSWQLNVNASRRETETSLFATLSYNFNDANKSGNIGMGYGHFRATDRREEGDGFTSQGNVVWHKTDDTNYGYTVGLQGNTDPINKAVGATYDIFKPQFQANTYITNYTDKVGNYAQYGGMFNTRFVLAQNKAAIGSGTLDDNTGVVVRVNAANPNASFDVYADDKIMLHLRANKNYLIKLQAYKTWHISVADTSNNLYYLRKKEKIITLYPGNVQALTWQATQMFVLGGQLVDGQNQPIKNALLKGAIGFAMTDDMGYFQANIDETVKAFSVYSDKDRCLATLPPVDKAKNVTFIGALSCNHKDSP